MYGSKETGLTGEAVSAAVVFSVPPPRPETMPALYETSDTHFIFARDAKSTLTPTPTQKVTLIVAGCYIVAIAILW
jgi:hypothetical protein